MPINLDNVVQPNMGGPTGSPNVDLGALAAGILHLVMDKPREVVQGGIGNFMPGEGSGNERFNAAVAETARQWEGIHVPQLPNQLLATPLAPLKLSESALNNMSALGPMAVNQGTDPWNVVGLGLPGKGAQALRGATALQGQMAPQVLARALDAAQWLESAPGRALAESLRQTARAGTAVLDSPLTRPLGRGIAGRMPMWETQAIPDMVRQVPQGQPLIERLVDTKLDPQSLLEALTAASAQSKVHARDSALTDTGRLMREMGHNFEDVLNEMNNAKSMFLDPVETVRGGLKVMDPAPNVQRLADLEDRAWQTMQGMSDPRAKLAGIEILGQMQRAVVEMWNDKLIQLDKAGIGQLQANAAHAAHDSFFREGYRELQVMYNAAVRAMKAVEREVGQLPKLDPATERQYSQLWDYSHQMMENARSTGPVMGMFPQPQAPMTFWGERLPGMQMQLADMLKDAVMPQRANLEHAIGGVRDTITGLPQGMRDQLLDPGTAGRVFGRSLDQTRMLEAGLPGVLADLPAYNRNVLMQHLDDLRKQSDVILGKTPAMAGAVGGGLRGKFEKTLQTIYEAQTGTPYTPMALGDDILTHFNQTIQSMNPAMADRLNRMFPNGIKTGQDFTEFARGLVPNSTLNSLRKDLTKYPGGDLLTADVFQLVKDRVIREYAKGLGLAEHQNPVMSALGREINLWKESALLAPAYHAANVLGGLFMQGLENVNPVRTAASMKENIGKILLGGPETEITPGHIQALMDRLEMQIPADATGSGAAMLRDETYNLARELAGKGVAASQQIGGLALAGRGAAFGGIAGKMSAPEDASWQDQAKSIALGAGIGAAAGGLFPRASAKNMDISRGLEDVLRKETFAEGVRRAIPGLRPELTRIVNDALNVVPEMMMSTGLMGQAGRQVVSLPIAPGTRKAIHDIIEHEQGIIGPDMLQGLLQRGGVSVDVARIAADEWRDALMGAQKSGLDLSNMINFNYKDLSNLQQVVRDYIPFSTWAMKAMPFFGRHLLENPWLPLKIAQLENASNTERERAGLPSRFAGAVHTPVADEIWSDLLGQKIKASYNPLRGLLPFSDIGRNAQGKPDENPIETAMRVGQMIGLPGLGPVPETAMTMLGLRGDDEPSRGYIRQANPIQAITGALGINRGAGIDFNRPFIEAQDAIRRGLGQHPIDLEKRSILNRLDELAYQKTGFTTNQTGNPAVEPFITAKVNESGPLWDQARRDVAAVRSRVGTGNFMLQAATPQAVLGPEEEAFRGARAQAIPPDTSRLFQDIARDMENNPQGDASKYVSALRTIAVQLSKPLYDQGVLPEGQIAPRLERLLAAPTATNINEVRQSIQKELSARNPVMGGYGQSGNTEEARLKVLLSAYNDVPALIKRDPSLAGLTPEQVQQLTDMASRLETMNPQVKQMLMAGKDPVAQQLKGIQSRRDAFRKQPGNELLDKYLNYMAASRGTGTMDGFFQQLTAGK